MREPRSPTTATTTTKIFSNGTIRGFPSGYLPSSCTSQSTNNLKHLPSMRQGTRPPPPPLPTRIGPSSIIKPPVDPPPPPPSTLRSLPLVSLKFLKNSKFFFGLFLCRQKILRVV